MFAIFKRKRDDYNSKLIGSLTARILELEMERSTIANQPRLVSYAQNDGRTAFLTFIKNGEPVVIEAYLAMGDRDSFRNLMKD